jgi:hypothetical protein
MVKCDIPTIIQAIKLADDLKLTKLHEKAIEQFAVRHEASQEDLKSLKKHDLIELMIKSWEYSEKKQVR